MKTRNAIALLWNRAEAEGGCFTIIDTPEQIMNIVRGNAIDGKVTHYHEALHETSKIFFDIDIKLPQSAMTNAAISEYCQTQLGYSADDIINCNTYAFEYRKAFGSALEQFIVYITQDVIMAVYSELFAADFETHGWRFSTDGQYR